jgi:sugar-specific transcriptional regulator TrmB
MFNELLSICGFNSSEQKVLQDLLEHERSTAGQIARRTTLKRPTVYAALDSLVLRGVVSKQKYNNLTYFSNVSRHLIPEILSSRAQRKFKEVQDAASRLHPYLEELSQHREHRISGFEVAAIDSIEAVFTQLESALTGGDFCAIFNPQKACVGKTGEVVERFLEKTAQTKPVIRELVVPGPLTDWYRSRIQNPNHSVRDISPPENLFSDIILFGDSIVINHYDPKGERSIQITEKQFHQSMMALFEMLWASAKIE